MLAARFSRRLHPRLLLRTSPRCARCRWHLRDGHLVGLHSLRSGRRPSPLPIPSAPPSSSAHPPLRCATSHPLRCATSLALRHSSWCLSIPALHLRLSGSPPRAARAVLVLGARAGPRFARRLHPLLLLRTSPRCARCRWHLRDGRLGGGAHRHSSRPAIGRPNLNTVLKLMHTSAGSRPLTPKRTWPVGHACNARRPQEREPS